MAAALVAAPAAAHHENDPCYPGETAGDGCGYTNGCPDGSEMTHGPDGYDCPYYKMTCPDGSEATQMEDGTYRCPTASGGSSETPPPHDCPEGTEWGQHPERGWVCYQPCPPGMKQGVAPNGERACYDECPPGTNATETSCDSAPPSGYGGGQGSDAAPPYECSTGWERTSEGHWTCDGACPDCPMPDDAGDGQCPPGMTAREGGPHGYYCEGTPGDGAEEYKGDTPPPVDCPSGWERNADGSWSCGEGDVHDVPPGSCPGGHEPTSSADGQYACPYGVEGSCPDGEQTPRRAEDDSWWCGDRRVLFGNDGILRYEDELVTGANATSDDEEPSLRGGTAAADAGARDGDAAQTPAPGALAAVAAGLAAALLMGRGHRR